MTWKILGRCQKMATKTKKNPRGAGRNRVADKRTSHILASQKTLETLRNCVPGCSSAGDAIALIAAAFERNYLIITSSQAIDLKASLKESLI